MTLKNYLILMGASTAVAAAGIAAILFTVDPDTASAATFAILYACVFLAVTGLFSIIGFSARVFILKRTLFISREVALAFRQAVLIGGVAVGALWLQGSGWLNWWTGTLLVVILTIAESFFISGETRRPQG